MRSNRPFPRFAFRVLLPALLLATCPGIACSTGAQEFGEPVDRSSAVPLSVLLASAEFDESELVTVSGYVGEVCRSAGCWFVLQETEEEEIHQIFVDLKPRADFTVTVGIQDRKAVVAGYVRGESPDLSLNAVGVLVE